MPERHLSIADFSASSRARAVRHSMRRASSADRVCDDEEDDEDEDEEDDEDGVVAV